MAFLAVAIAVVMFYLYAPYFQKLSPEEYSITLPISLEGPMKVNDKLDHVVKLHENNIHWPESMAVHEGKIYTGLGDGRIVEISDTYVKDVCRIGNSCGGQHEEHICGRPLGMEFDAKGLLYVVDAYHGIFTIDVKSGKKKLLVPSSKYVDNKPLTFLNDIAIDNEEKVLYITQSSSKWNISSVTISIFEHESSGRLLKYDIRQNTISVLGSGYFFTNGIELSHDKQSILFVTGNTVQRYYIKGKKKGTFEKMPLILPGIGDNISKSKRGNYWIALAASHTADSPALYDRISAYPSLRKALLIVCHFIVHPISTVMNLLPYKEIKETGSEMVNLRIVSDILPSSGLIIEFNEAGNVIQSLHSNGKVSYVSEVLDHDGHLYLGSWRNRFLGKLKI